MRRGVRLGIDLGEVRIGVARSDIEGLMAVPLTTVARGEGDLAAVAGLASEWQALEVLVGLPLRMDGTEGPAVGKIRAWVHALQAGHPELRVRLIDERLSTVQATSQLRQSGRNSRQSRSIVDQAAAVVIVESALARERATGQPAGIEP
jgi:putative holliday junction resolvase